MKKFFFCLTIAVFFLASAISAQIKIDNRDVKRYKVAVFAPLYLDSVFNSDNTLRNDKAIPKFIQPALEFVHGAQIAFDSLSLNNESIEATIYDTKSFSQPLLKVLQSKSLDNVNLIIGSVKDMDYRELADFSMYKKIPFISATFPNDGGVVNNPYVVIMNSTLKSHCEGIYSYILQTHGTDKIYLIKKPGAQEDKIAGIFKSLNEQEGRPLLNIQTITFDSSFTENAFTKKLDSNRNSVIIGGSLAEGFAKNLADVCYDARKSYPLTLIGMPNWDGFKFFAKADDYKDMPVYFTTPFYVAKNNLLINMLDDEYNKRFKAKPGDMVYKGFETIYYFTNLLIKYPEEIIAHLNDNSSKVFCEYNFRPVSAIKNNAAPDYFENKHLYVMRILNGEIGKEW